MAGSNKTTKKTRSSKPRPIPKKSSRVKAEGPVETASPRRFSFLKPSWLDRKTLVIILLLVGILGYGGWSYMNQKSLVDSLKDPNKSEEVIRDELVKEVKKIAIIPEDEKPIIIEVNLRSVAGQPFYNLAEEGDRVLLYTEAKRAILYRPSTNQIVNISNDIQIQDSNTRSPEAGSNSQTAQP